MARQKGSRSGRCQGCNHLERVRIERLLAAGASIKAAARKFEIDYHALRRHWRNHVSAEARAAYLAGAGAIITGSSAGRCTRGSAPLRSWATAMLWGCSRGGCTRISGIADD